MADINFLQDSNMSEPDLKYPCMPEINPVGVIFSSINFGHTNIYMIYIYMLCRFCQMLILQNQHPLIYETLFHSSSFHSSWPARFFTSILTTLLAHGQDFLTTTSSYSSTLPGSFSKSTN